MNDTVGKLRVQATCGAQFDVPIGQSFQLKDLVREVRSAGYWFNGMAFVPYEKIEYIAVIPMSMGEETAAGQTRSELQ